METCIVIDVHKKEIRAEELTHPILDKLQSVVGGLITTALTLDNTNDLFVDDEGLLKDSSLGFVYKGAHQPFAGNGVIVGHDTEGETIAATIPIEEVKKCVRFFDDIAVEVLLGLPGETDAF